MHRAASHTDTKVIQSHVGVGRCVGLTTLPPSCAAVAYPGIFFGGGFSTNSVEDRENGDLGVVAP